MSEETRMKSMVEQLVKDLKLKGVKVNSAAILNMEDTDLGKSKDAPDFDQIIKNAINKVREKQSQKENKEEENKKRESNEPCFCPNCFNFENFEENLKGDGANFYYADVKLGGKVFNIKYYSGPYGKQFLAQEQGFKLDPQFNLEQLQELLSTAVANKRYDEAQTIVDAINKIKNQKV